MPPRIVIIGALFLAQTLTASAAGTATQALQVCGTLREHRESSATAVGSLTIGSRQYSLATGAIAGNGGVDASPGKDVCIQASQALTGGQLVQYTFFPVPQGRVCGNRLASTTVSVTLAADFGELTLRKGPDVPAGQARDRLCYAVEVDPGSGDLAAIGTLPVRDIDREWASACGTIREYTRATGSASGSITVGSRPFRIGMAVGYTGDPAGDRTDRTATGANMCLRGRLGAAGELVEYLTTPMPSGISLRAVAYTPPAGAQSGLAITAYMSRSAIRIPATVDATIDVSRGTHCFSTTVDANGDISAGAVVACQPGVATGPGPSTTPAGSPAATSAATTASATPAPTVSPSATPAAVAAVSPSPRASTTTVRVGPDPLLVAGLMGITALGLLAIYLVRRRA